MTGDCTYIVGNQTWQCLFYPSSTMRRRWHPVSSPWRHNCCTVVQGRHTIQKFKPPQFAYGKRNTPCLFCAYLILYLKTHTHTHTHKHSHKHTHTPGGSHLYLIPQGEDWPPAACRPNIPWTNKFANLKNKGEEIRNRWSD